MANIRVSREGCICPEAEYHDGVCGGPECECHGSKDGPLWDDTRNLKVIDLIKLRQGGYSGPLSLDV